MQAITYTAYGSADVLRLEAIDKPTPKDNEVLIQVQAASVNPVDLHNMLGTPFVVRAMSGLRRPTTPRLGVDFAGRVEAVGPQVTQFQPGDEVFGGRTGAFAEYVVKLETGLVRKPANLTFAQAAAIPVAGCTALQGLRDHGRLQAGQRVLINGAAGGVGTFAVQIAKAMGAHVTGVCSPRNVDLVRALGADEVLDYTQTDFTQAAQRYDLLLDNVGNHALAAARRVLTPAGVMVMVAGPVERMLLFMAAARLGNKRLVAFIAELNKADLETLKDMAEAGQLTPAIDRSYPLAEVPAAMRYLETGHARSKIIINVAG